MNQSTCSIDGCDKPRRRCGFCGMHHQRVLRSGVPGSSASTIAELGSPCVVCGGVVPVGSGRRKHCSGACQMVDSRTKGNRATQFTCRLCGKTVDIKRRVGGRLQRKDTIWCRECGRDSPDAMRFKKYGVTPDQYAAALLAGCEVCGDLRESLHVDHDHSCCNTGHRTCGNCVRGFLCGNCNRALGMFRDDVDLLRAAIAYLTP